MWFEKVGISFKSSKIREAFSVHSQPICDLLESWKNTILLYLVSSLLHDLTGIVLRRVPGAGGRRHTDIPRRERQGSDEIYPLLTSTRAQPHSSQSDAVFLPLRLRTAGLMTSAVQLTNALRQGFYACGCLSETSHLRLLR